MKYFVVERTDRLSGRVTVGGCKNTSLKILLAFPQVAKGELTMLRPGTNTQTKFAVQVLKECGAIVEETPGSLKLRAEFLDTRCDVFDRAVPQMRHFIRMAVPMVTHGGNAKIPLPGYSPYGSRPFEPVGKSLHDFRIKTAVTGNYATFHWHLDDRLSGMSY